MLYDRWRRIAREFAGKTALIDLSSQRQWNFSELARAAENSNSSPQGVVFPQGTSAEFVLSVLEGWKAGAVVCPLEQGQQVEAVQQVPPGCVHLKTTSASTGAPRLVAFGGEQLLADVNNIIATMGLRADWPNLAVISLAHSYGFSNLVLPLLLHGIPLILAHAPLPETLRQAGQRWSKLTVPAVPALWRTWLDAKALPASIQLAISAGAPLPLALEEEVFKDCGLKLHNFYGATECGGMAYDASGVPRSDAACAGSPMANVDLSVNEEGRLGVRSRAVGLTYWPEPSAELRDGFFQTSDLAQIQGGVVFLRGRRSDQINIAGRKVSPELIERVLASHGAVEECLVFGAPSPDHRTEIIVACLSTRSAARVEELKRHLLERLPAWQVPREWWFVPSLQTNARGKLSRAEWRRRYLERSA
jgi:acyl-CoA synthetase (AMP-forming)/AMP-acid ligase II